MPNNKITDKTIDALLAKLLSSGSSVNEDNLKLEVLIENLPKITGSFEEKLNKIISVDKTLGKVISAIKRIGKRRDEIKQILGIASSPKSVPGFGALSSEEAYEKSGWRTINGINVWTRPTNIGGITEHFPPQATAFAADYQEVSIPGYNQATALVTSEQAAQMRKEDAEAEAIKKSKMTDYDRFIYENKGVLGEKGADAKYRQMLLKQLPPFFRDSKLSTKSLIDIGKLIKSAKGIPLVGRLMHPIALGFAGVGVASAAFSKIDEANRTMASWYPTEQISGKPSEAFKKAMYLSGAKDYSTILKEWQSLVKKYVYPELAIPQLGAMLSMAPEEQRIQIAQSQGFSNTVASAMMRMYKGDEADLPESVRYASREAEFDELRKRRLESGSSWIDKIRGWLSYMPFEKYIYTRRRRTNPRFRIGRERWRGDELLYPEATKSGFDKTEGRLEDISTTYEEADGAAKSLDYIESHGGPSSISQDNSKNVTMNVHIDKVENSNPEEFKEGLVRMADSASDDNRALLLSFGSGYLA